MTDKLSVTSGCEFSRYYRRLMWISARYRCCGPISTSFTAQQRSKLANLLNVPANFIRHFLIFIPVFFLV